MKWWCAVLLCLLILPTASWASSEIYTTPDSTSGGWGWTIADYQWEAAPVLFSDNTYFVDAARFYMFGVSDSPSIDLWVTTDADGGGACTIPATGATKIATATLDYAEDWYLFDFSGSPVTMDINTTYWLELRPTTDADEGAVEWYDGGVNAWSYGTDDTWMNDPSGGLPLKLYGWAAPGLPSFALVGAVPLLGGLLRKFRRR